MQEINTSKNPEERLINEQKFFKTKKWNYFYRTLHDIPATLKQIAIATENSNQIIKKPNGRRLQSG
ncbi:hypothetical protein D3C73_1527330 [compost metagenome]